MLSLWMGPTSTPDQHPGCLKHKLSACAEMFLLYPQRRLIAQPVVCKLHKVQQVSRNMGAGPNLLTKVSIGNCVLSS